MNSKEAELIGMHTGDGTLYKTNSGSIVWELRGSKEEKEYYSHISELLNSLFGVSLAPKERSGGLNGCYGIQTCNKAITRFFIEQGFKPGPKAHTAYIFDTVKNGNKTIKYSFIRGLFDTDGCLRFEKNRTKIRYYPRIEFGFASKNLREDLFNLLSSLGFKVYRWDDKDCLKLGLAGFENLKRWMSKISPKNSKHLIRYSNWKKLSPDGPAVTAQISR